MKRAFLFTGGYGALLFLIGAWFTSREYYSTMLAVTLWFMLPMTITFFIETLLLSRKRAPLAFYWIAASLNTMIMFLLMVAIGIWWMQTYFYIPF